VTETLPGVTTLYHCPMPGCTWEHAEPPPGLAEDARTLADVFGTGVFASIAIAQRLEKTEAVLRDHLGSHKLEEWVKALTEANEKLTAIRSAIPSVLRVAQDFAGSMARILGEEQAGE
jgi:hypothetical protein